MILSSMELLYLAAYWILVYEYVVMRHEFICSESDARIYSAFDDERTLTFICGDIDKWEYKATADALYWNRGTK